MKKSGRNLEVFLGMLIFLSFIILCPGLSRAADVILSEDFEDNALDSRIHIETIGDITNPSSGIKDITEFGSTKAFGFGKSTCGADCWDANITKLIIQFPTPTYVSYISFKEIELYGNWGSGGKVFIDGDPLIINGRQVSETFGRLPYNDYIADTAYRTQTLLINKTISTIEIQSWDITNVSEIFIDDLQIFGADHPIGVICQVIHNSDYDPDPGSLNNLITEIINRTGNNEIFYGGFVALDSVPACNMLYITGHYYPFSFTETQRANLLSYLQNGGLLFADDCSNYLDNEGFETSFRAEIQNILGQNLDILPTDHPVFSSFYNLSGTLPTAWNNEPLEGIDLGNRTVVIYSDNDYGCAWEGDSGCDISCRENSFEMGTNIALYKLNSDNVTKHQLQINISGTGSGAVESSDGKISCGSDCTEEYDNGSSVTLTATPNSGSTFAFWDDGMTCLYQNPRSFDIKSDIILSAVFTVPLLIDDSLPITGNTINPVLANGKWTGQPSTCTKLRNYSNAYLNYYAIDNYYALTEENNPVYWIIRGSGFGTQEGEITFSNPDISISKIVRWTNNEIRIIPTAPYDFTYDSNVTLTVKNEWGLSDTTNIPVAGMLRSRGFGQCTWYVAKTLISQNKCIPDGAYSTSGAVDENYVPQQWDGLTFGTTHVAVITSEVQKNPPIKNNKNTITAYTFTVKEMNADPICGEQESTFTEGKFVIQEDSKGRRIVTENNMSALKKNDATRYFRPNNCNYIK